MASPSVPVWLPPAPRRPAPRDQVVRWVVAGVLVLLGWSEGLAQPASTPWPTFRQNMERTGATALLGPEHPVELWRYRLGGLTYSSATLDADGTVYIGSARQIHAVREGRRVWAVPVGDYAISTPTLTTGGQALVGSLDETLYALNRATGAQPSGPLFGGEPVWTSPAIDADGVVYFGTELDSGEGFVRAVNPDGTPRWSFLTRGLIISSPALGQRGLYVGSLDGDVYGIGYDGTALWPQPFPTGREIISTPALGPDETIYIGSLDGNLYAIDPATGAARWSFAAQDSIASSPAIGPDGTIYIGSVDGNLYAVNPSGARRWAFQTGARIVSSPAVDAEGTVYVGSLNGRFYAINPDGSQRWVLQLDSPIWSSPAIGPDRTLYIATTGTPSQSGFLYAIGSSAFAVAPGDAPTEGTALPVEVAVTDFAPDRVTLFYRRGGETPFGSSEMIETQADQYEASIPSEYVTARGLEYYVETVQGSERITFPAQNPEGRPATLRVRVPAATTPTNLIPRRYALVSVPLDLDNARVADVLGDDFGAYEPTRWRALQWNGTQYREFPDLGALTPGTSVLVAVATGGAFDVEGGRTVDTSAPFSITLQPGWNHVANPFGFPVAWSDVDRDAEAVNAVARFEGDGWQLDPASLDTLRLQPWSGYLVNNRTTEPVTISILPREASAVSEGITGGASEPELFSVQLRARAGASSDAQNWVGFAPQAAVGDDAFDIPDLPAPDAGVALSVIEGGAAYARNLKPGTEHGAEWRLAVQAPARTTVDLTLIPEAALPDGFEMTVLDGATQERLPVVGGRVHVAVEANVPRELVLVIGAPAYLDRHYPDAVTAFTTALGPTYPNPFADETTLSYQLGERTHVRLDIFNVLGQRVQTLVDAEQPPGAYTATWDGTGPQGAALASGVYVCTLTTGAFSATRTLLLVR